MRWTIALAAFGCRTCPISVLARSYDPSGLLSPTTMVRTAGFALGRRWRTGLDSAGCVCPGVLTLICRQTIFRRRTIHADSLCDNALERDRRQKTTSSSSPSHLHRRVSQRLHPHRGRGLLARQRSSKVGFFVRLFFFRSWAGPRGVPGPNTAPRWSQDGLKRPHDDPR